MKNYEYEDWLDSNYLTADYTNEELDELYEMCMKLYDMCNKNKSFENKDEQFPF